MQRFFLDIEKLLIGDPSDQASTAHVFVAQPTPLEEQALGRLFMVIEIAGHDEHAAAVIRLIQTEMQQRYYRTEELNMSAAFEQALASTNRKLHSLISDGITEWLKEFSVLIGVIKEERIFFTHLGRVEMFLIFGKRIVGVIDHTQPEQVNPLKIFSSIVEGELREGSSLLITTSTLLDYFSQEKLRQLMVSRPSHEAVVSLEQLLHEHQYSANFAVIAARLIPAHDEVPSYRVTESERPVRVRTTSDVSMDELIAREQKTNELLAPSILAEAGKRTRKIVRDFSVFWRTKVQRKPRRRIMPSGIVRPRRTEERPHYFLKTVGALERGIRYLTATTARGIRKLRNEKPLKERALELPKGTEGFLSRQILRFQRLPKNKKIILTVALVALVVFAQSIVFLGQRSRNAKEAEELAGLFRTVEENILDARSALSFGDLSGAQDLLRENLSRLGELSPRRKQDRERAEELTAETEAVLQETRNIRDVSTLIMKADFTTLSPEATGTLLLAAGGTLYSLNPNTNALYAIGMDELRLTVIPPPDFTLGKLALATVDGERLLFLNSDNALFAYSTGTRSWSALTLPIPAGEHTFTAMTVFRDRLYLLDTTGNQIYRFPKVSGGYGGAFSWIRDEITDLTGAVDLDIDGAIYVTMENGAVRRYFQGARESYSLTGADPEVNSAASLWVSEAGTDLYILDTPGKRIVRFTKEGRFLEQYQLSTETVPVAFEVDESGGRVFVLTGSTVGEFSLAQ